MANIGQPLPNSTPTSAITGSGSTPFQTSVALNTIKAAANPDPNNLGILNQYSSSNQLNTFNQNNGNPVVPKVANAPVTPVVPVKPVVPAAPIAPVKPVAPVAPVVAPAPVKAPVGQVNPNIPAPAPITPNADLQPAIPAKEDYTPKIQTLLSGGYDNVASIASALGISTTDAQASVNSNEDLSYQMNMNSMLNKNTVALQNAQTKLDNISNGIFTLSPSENALIQATKDAYTQMEQSQASANSNYEGAVQTDEIRSGRQEFMNSISSGIMKGAVDSGLQKIQALETQAIGKVNDLQQAFEDKRYTAAKDIYNGLQTDLKDKTTAIENMHKDVMAQAKVVQDATAAADAHISSVNNNLKITQDIAKTTATNSADMVIGQLTGDPTHDGQVIAAAAKQLGIDPGVLQNAITDRKLAIQKQLLADQQAGFDMSKPYVVGQTVDDQGVKSDVYGVYDPTSPNGYKIVTMPNTSSSGGNSSSSWSGDTGMRTDRHNNPTAMTTDVAKTGGLVEGVDYTKGDPFTTQDGKTLYTAKFLGDPITTTIKAIDTMGFQTQAGQNRWTYTQSIPNANNKDWPNLTAQQKQDVVRQMYQNEGGNGSLVGEQGLGNKDSGFNKNTGLYSGPSLEKGSSPQEITDFLSTGPSLSVKGGASYDQTTLYNSAILSLLGAPDSSIGGMGSAAGRSAIGNKLSAITKAYNISPMDIAAAKTDYKALTGAQVKLTTQAVFINTFAKTAIDNLNLALQQSANVPRTGAKFVNKYAQWAQGNFTPAGPLATLETYIYTASREYAKVTSGGAMSAQGLTDSAQKEAERLMNAAQSPEALTATINAMKADMSNVSNEMNKSVNQLPSAIASIVKQMSGGANQSPSQPQSVKLQDPKTGKTKSFDNLSADDLKTALGQGYKQIQ